MYSRDSFFAAIKAFTGYQNMLVIPRELVHFLGDINAALLLSQLIYWQGKGAPEGWIYKSYVEWNEELALSEYQVRRAANRLEKEGFLQTKLKKANGSPTLHYRLNWSTFSDSFLKFLQNRNSINFGFESEVTQDSLTKTTTKITSNKCSGDVSETDRLITFHYQNTFGRFPNQIQVSKLSQYTDKGMELELIFSAMNKARENGKDLGYAFGILSKQFDRGIRTVSQAEIDEAEYQAAVAGGNKYGQRNSQNSSNKHSVRDDEWKEIESKFFE